MSKEAMKRFLIETSVENAEGSQTWYVDATSEDEALKKYEQGGCDLYASNVEVTSIGEPEISGETTIDDFGDFAEQPAPVQQEPLGFMNAGNILEMQQKSLPYAYVYPVKSTGVSVAIYTSPQPAQRKPLTDEQIVAKALHLSGLGTSPDVIQFARAIEAAHGIFKDEK